MPRRFSTWRAGGVLCLAALLGGCASTRVVPFTVQSDPLGAHVLYQVQTPGEGATTTANDWIYLGLTPVDVRREISKSRFKANEAFVLRVVKDGYLDQQKSWSGDELADEMRDKEKVFWNPRLVPSSQ
ncbi:MAG: hypothetical protein DWQ08_08865 [Proteobacteria bacterium]|nr:MAG: hypothetical protein DWQ08_08865 [Pseudomonadota bacterium]